MVGEDKGSWKKVDSEWILSSVVPLSVIHSVVIKSGVKSR